MKIRKVNRYYCEFCGKGGCAAGHMKRHEKGCTLNPKRVCGICGVLKENQKPIEELTAILPNHELFKVEDQWQPNGFHYDEKMSDEINKILPKLRDLAENCPACIMAALRQSSTISAARDFHFKEEMKALWEQVNEDRMASREYY